MNKEAQMRYLSQLEDFQRSISRAYLKLGKLYIPTPFEKANLPQGYYEKYEINKLARELKNYALAHPPIKLEVN